MAERRPNNTRTPPFTSPLPISLPLARPPPTLLGEELFITSPPAQRSEVGGEVMREAFVYGLPGTTWANRLRNARKS